jgi:hypothetical protein
MFYVYVYKDPRPTKNLQVVYVGKGTGERAYAHWRGRVSRNKAFGAFLALLRREKLEPVIEIVKSGLDEAEAFVEECALIAAYGRRDLKTGTLFNLTDGGEGWGLGVVRTEDWRKNISNGLSAPECATRLSAAATARWADPEYREKTVQAIREALKRPEVIARREAGKAAFVHTEEFRETMRAASLKLWQDPVYAERVKKAQLEGHQQPKVQAAKSAASKRLWANKHDEMVGRISKARQTDASRAKTGAQSRQQWANPEYAAKQTANNKEIANRGSVKAAKAAALKARWADPEWRARMLESRRKKHLDTPESP